MRSTPQIKPCARSTQERMSLLIRCDSFARLTRAAKHLPSADNADSTVTGLRLSTGSTSKCQADRRSSSSASNCGLSIRASNGKHARARVPAVATSWSTHSSGATTRRFPSTWHWTGACGASDCSPAHLEELEIPNDYAAMLLRDGQPMWNKVGVWVCLAHPFAPIAVHERTLRLPTTQGSLRRLGQELSDENLEHIQSPPARIGPGTLLHARPQRANAYSHDVSYQVTLKQGAHALLAAEAFTGLQPIIFESGSCEDLWPQKG